MVRATAWSERLASTQMKTASSRPQASQTTSVRPKQGRQDGQQRQQGGEAAAGPPGDQGADVLATGQRPDDVTEQPAAVEREGRGRG